jgi:serine/threonine-protein kinase
VSALAAESPTIPRRIASRRAVLVATATIVILAVAGWMLNQNRRAVASSPVVNSVAVLPFVDMSPDKAQEHLASGVAEGILNALANVPGLNVPARSSSFQFKGEDVNLREVADRLHVDAVLEGSIQLVGDRLRINAQLAHPRSGYQLFSKQYDGSAAQVFELQDQIAKAIVEELQVHIAAGTDPQLVKSATRNFTAYNLYLRGVQASKSPTGDALQSAVRYLEEATRIDSTFALAHASLADAYVALSDHGYLSEELALPRALAAVGRALALDSASAEAHTALGHMWNEPGRWKDAERSFRRAIQLRPSYAAAHMWLGNNLMVRGHTAGGLKEFQRAHELDPLSPSIAAGLSQALSITGDAAGAVTVARRATEMAPRYPWAHATLAGALTAQRHFDEAIAEANKAVQLSGEHANALATLAAVHARAGKPQIAREILARLNAMQGGTVGPAAQALVHANLGEFDRAFALLSRKPGLNSAAREWLRVNPIWQPLRVDARWPQLLKSLGLED